MTFSKAAVRFMMAVMASSLVTASVAAAAELPVKGVTLYKHGVGFFERSGELKAGETARLEFKAAEMNDVLKSLIVRESGGARVTGLRYDSSDPLDKKLSEYPFDLNQESPSVAAFLNQLKGAAVEVVFGSETLKGTIVGARLVPAGEKTPEREQLVLLSDSGDLRTVDLGSATSIRFPDPALQTQFRDYLRTLASGRTRERRAVYIDSASDRARQIAVSYLTPSPVWKSSYRLVLRDAESQLEGWAIVDNTSSEDWNKVRLAVVSGRPISFISRLYEPKYATRYTADLPEDRAQAPVLHEGALLSMGPQAGVVGGVHGGVPGGVIGGIAGAVPSAAPAPPPARAYDRFSRAEKDAAMVDEARMSTDSSIDVQLQATEAGDLFEYRFSEPVTVRKGESAMIPFLQQKISARKLLIYTSANPRHPMNAAEITNNTGKTLDGGPLTVFDAEIYAGEGLIETLKAGDKRLLSYAVDLGTRISTMHDSESTIVREIKASRGVLRLRNAARETKTYTVKNVDAKPKTLWIEHPVRSEYKLIDVKPIESSATQYRFEVKLAANGEAKFPVTEEREFNTTVSVSSLTPSALLSYSQNKLISEDGQRQLEAIAKLKSQIATLDTDMKRLNTGIEKLFRDQERLRQNINSLNQVAGQQEQVRRYAKTLDTQESELAGMRDQYAAAETRRNELQAQIDGLIDNVKF
jgi:hypothetical protein